jgi:hypothetical protein
MLRNVTLARERDAQHARRSEVSSVRLSLIRGAQVPPRRFVTAGGALERHAPALEVQERVVPVETTQELPNLIGNHCAETPFQVAHPV